MPAKNFTVICCTALCLGALSVSCLGANDRPLIFGMNPIPMEWWGYDPAVWNPMQFAKMAEAGCTAARISGLIGTK